MNKFNPKNEISSFMCLFHFSFFIPQLSFLSSNKIIERKDGDEGIIAVELWTTTKNDECSFPKIKLNWTVEIIKK